MFQDNRIDIRINYESLNREPKESPDKEEKKTDKKFPKIDYNKHKTNSNYLEIKKITPQITKTTNTVI